MSGRRSRDKGSRAERAVLALLQQSAFAAEKVSGMYRPGEDISVPLLGVDRTVEVKCRATGFGRLYSWLEQRDFLIVKSDRREFLVVLPLRTALEIARIAECNKSEE